MIGIGSPNEPLQTANRLRPMERIDIIFNSEHGGRIVRIANKNSLNQLCAIGETEDFGDWPLRLISGQPLNRPRAENDHAMGRFATQNLLPRKGDDIELGPIETLRKSC